MKAFFAILSILLFAACKNRPSPLPVTLPPESSTTITVKLVDSLGNVTVTLPVRYDTSFSWTHHSDCGKSCDKIKYRFQPKALRISKESGWIWLNEPKDSIERFTIVHSGDFPFHDITDTSFILKYHEIEKEELVQNPATHKIASDTVEKIGDRYYSIFTIDLYDTAKHQYTKKLLAATTIKSNDIHFNFELLTKRKDSATNNFIRNSMYYLKSIHLSTSP